MRICLTALQKSLMKALRLLLEGIPCSWNGKGELATQIACVHSDSRKIKTGDLFVSTLGLKVDGHQFIFDAIQKGAKAIVSERFDSKVSELGIPQFVVSDSSSILSRLVASSYDFPAQKLTLIGITGTNGKTTTAFLAQHLLNSVSRAGLIGSIQYDDGKTKEAAEYTTPIPEVLNEVLARMVANGLSYCVMEVSSHALAQSRTQDFEFSSALFTNLTQDHLDFHQDFEEYYQAKRKLFFGETSPRHSIVNLDDPFGLRLAVEIGNRGDLVSYGLNGTRDYSASGIQMDWKGLSFDLTYKGNQFRVAAPLLLRHNVYNVLTALSTVLEEGFSFRELVPYLSQFPGVVGRMERIDEGQDFHVFIDYAHTPDGLLSVLSSLQGLPRNRVISVFGCGGDRDRRKRPIMGEIGSRFSDVLILTSDNPRGEKPEDILDQIRSGIPWDRKRADVIVISNRSEAIRQAIEMAEPCDLVLIFGKGHEPYQILGKEKIPFSDQSVARHWLRERCLRSTKLHKFAAGH